MILSTVLILVFLLIVIVGSIIVSVVANHKWGYTQEREQELENNKKL